MDHTCHNVAPFPSVWRSMAYRNHARQKETVPFTIAHQVEHVRSMVIGSLPNALHVLHNPYIHFCYFVEII